MDPPNDVDFAIESAEKSSYPPYHNVAVESRERKRKRKRKQKQKRKRRRKRRRKWKRKSQTNVEK